MSEQVTFTLKPGRVVTAPRYSYSVDGGPWCGLYDTPERAYGRAECAIGAEAVVRESTRFSGMPVDYAAKEKISRNEVSIRVAVATNPVPTSYEGTYTFTVLVLDYVRLT